MPMIDFGAENGSTAAGNTIRPYVKKLFEIFYESQSSTDYFSDIEKFHIVFLVSGKNKDFGSEGIEGLKKVRGRPVIIVYFAIPQSRWDGAKESGFREYLANSVKDCFLALCDKASKSKSILDEARLQKDFETGMSQFENG